MPFTWQDPTIPDFSQNYTSASGGTTGTQAASDPVSQSLIQALQALQAAGVQFGHTPDGTLVDAQGRVYNGVQAGSGNTFVVNGVAYGASPGSTITPSVEGQYGTYTGPNPNNRNTQTTLQVGQGGQVTQVNEAAQEASAIGGTLAGADVSAAAQAGWNVVQVNVPGIGPMSFLAPAGSRLYIDPTKAYTDQISAREAVQIVGPDDPNADAYFAYATSNPNLMQVLSPTASAPASAIDTQAQIAALPNRQGYAKLPTGQTDYTKYADGSATGLDARGQPPYMADGTANPNYTGAAPYAPENYDPRGYLKTNPTGSTQGQTYTPQQGQIQQGTPPAAAQPDRQSPKGSTTPGTGGGTVGNVTPIDPKNPGKSIAPVTQTPTATGGDQAAIDAYRAATSSGQAVNQTGAANPFGYTQEQLDAFAKKYSNPGPTLPKPQG